MLQDVYEKTLLTKTRSFTAIYGVILVWQIVTLTDHIEFNVKCINGQDISTELNRVA